LINTLMNGSMVKMDDNGSLITDNTALLSSQDISLS